jgi:hypothetical protein
MARHQQEWPQLTRLPRAESDTSESSCIDSVSPHTIFVTVTATTSSRQQQLASPLTPSYHTSIFSNSSHISSASSSRRLSTSSYPHVPSETEVPERWHPKYLDGETEGKIPFLGWAAAIVVLGVLCLMSVTAWKSLYRVRQS